MSQQESSNTSLETENTACECFRLKGKYMAIMHYYMQVSGSHGLHEQVANSSKFPGVWLWAT